MSALSEQIRKQFQEGDDVRDAGLTTPEDIARYDDILYGSDAKWQVLDVYRPKSAKGRTLPVIFSIHGGGWVYGDKERYQYYCMSLAQRGFAVVNFTYRLAPEFLFPAPIEDTNLVAQWICAHAKEYGLDLEHIFAVGDSAGAHALGIYSNFCTNPDYAARFSFQAPPRFRIRAVALNCGEYQIRLDKKDEELTRALMGEYLPEKGTAGELELIDVTAHVTPQFPPAFLMSSTGDFLQGQLPLMMQALLTHAVPFVCRFYGDEKNRLGHVFHCDMRLADAARCNDDECAFFQSFCVPEDKR